MPPPPNLELLSCEDRILFALQAIKCDASLSIRRAAAIYNVPRSTLGDQRTGMTAQRDLHPSRSNLSKHEEEVLIKTIRKLDEQGFAPTLPYISRYGQPTACRTQWREGRHQLGFLACKPAR
jgi:hypothetical protein